MTDSPATALITGASGGIGAHIAERLAHRGYRVILTGRDRAKLEALAERIGEAAPCVVYPLDLADVDAIAPAVDDWRAQYAPIEVLVNNAGGGFYHRFVDQPPERHARLMQVNYFAPVALMRLLLPAMLQRRRGWVINIASMSAKVGPWGHGGYASAKAALISLTQTLAAEHHGEGVHFSYVNPGIVQTPYYDRSEAGHLLQSMRRHAISPDRVARAVERLLDRPRLAGCVPWHHRAIDWLSAVSPQLAHTIVRRQSRPGKTSTSRATVAPSTTISRR